MAGGAPMKAVAYALDVRPVSEVPKPTIGQQDYWRGVMRRLEALGPDEALRFGAPDDVLTMREGQARRHEITKMQSRISAAINRRGRGLWQVISDHDHDCVWVTRKSPLETRSDAGEGQGTPLGATVARPAHDSPAAESEAQTRPADERGSTSTSVANGGSAPAALFADPPAATASAAVVDGAGPLQPAPTDQDGGEGTNVAPPGPAAVSPSSRYERVPWNGNKNKCKNCGYYRYTAAHRALCPPDARRRPKRTIFDLKPERSPETQALIDRAFDKADDRLQANVAAGLVCSVRGCGGRMFRDDDGPYCLSGHRPREALPPEIELPESDNGRARKREPSHAGRAL